MKRYQLSFSTLVRLLILGGIFIILITSIGPQQVSSSKAAVSETFVVYLPIVGNPKEHEPIMLGISPRSYWLPTLTEALDKEFASVDSWSGKQLSLASVYHSFDQESIVDYMLSNIWDAGYTPFVNISTFDYSIREINSGEMDHEIRAWARAYAAFANNGQRMAYLLPLQEMNGNWVSYGSSNPAYFISAFNRIVNIFAAEGVPDDSVQWVFAPNGLSYTNWPDFEAYYPGDAVVDGLAFSSFNYGFHPTNNYPRWENPDQIYTEYIQRMNVMAPEKPIFLAQMGTTAYGPNGYDTALKNQWLIDAYNLFIHLDGVRGILYYNDHNRFDWSFYRPAAGAIFPGYIDGTSSDVYQYISPEDLRDLIAAP